jgi:hypothetical protein
LLIFGGEGRFVRSNGGASTGLAATNGSGAAHGTPRTAGGAPDGGQFFTPREIIRLMVHVADPKIGQTVYDPGCGTGGFLAEAYAWMKAQVKKPQHLDTLKRCTFYGRETDDMTYPIALANLLLHGAVGRCRRRMGPADHLRACASCWRRNRPSRHAHRVAHLLLGAPLRSI